MFVVIHSRPTNPDSPPAEGFPRVCGWRPTKKQAVAFAEDVRGQALDGDVVDICKSVETYDVERTVRLKLRAPTPEAPAEPPAATAATEGAA